MNRKYLVSTAIVLTLGTGIALGGQETRGRRVQPQTPPAGATPSPGVPADTSSSGPVQLTTQGSQPVTQQAALAVAVKCGARYDGGSLGLDHDQKLTIEVKDGVLALRTKSASFEIPANQITELNYSQKSRSRAMEGAPVAVVSPAAGVVIGSTKTTAHYVEILWAGSAPGGVSLRIDKNDIRGLLAALEASTGVRTRSDGGAIVHDWN